VGQVGAGWSTFPVGAVVHPLHYSFPGDLRGEPGARTKRQRIDTSLDVPLVPMECPAKDRYRIMIKCPVSAITSAGFCCSQGFPQIGAKAEISTPTLVVSVVLPAARRPVCKPPSHPGIQVRPSGICCPPWSEVEEMSALRQAQVHTRAARDPAYMGLDQEVEYRNRPSYSLPLISSASWAG
jgi:hypothetical protein